MKKSTTTWEVRWPRPAKAGTLTRGADLAPVETIAVGKETEPEARALALTKALEGNRVTLVRLDATEVETFTKGSAESFLTPVQHNALPMPAGYDGRDEVLG